MMSPVLDVSRLSKKYGDFPAVKEISFSIAPGEIVGLLGPNGAGKTTTIQMLLGLTEPSGGTIRYFDLDFRMHREEILSRINFVSAYSNMQTRTTVWENLHVFSMLYNVRDWKKKVIELADRLDISKKFSDLYWRLSSGERARVNLVKAFLNDPELILMDEPTASLDPEIVSVVLNLVREVRKEKNTAILYTSHNMGEVSKLCDRVIFLHHGTILASDTPLGLSRQVADATVRLTLEEDDPKIQSFFSNKKYVYKLDRDHVVSISIDEKHIPLLLTNLGKAGMHITDIEIDKPNLEDVFLAVAREGSHALA